MNSVTVLMSTYNGEQYIREQIDSVLNQSGVDVRLLIRDDGSTDGTLGILDEYSKNDQRINYYTGDNIGPAYSFMDLVTKAEDSEYYAFCDQDDVWLDNKLEKAINMLGKTSDSPMLYYSNLKVVDSNLNFIKMMNDRGYPEYNRYTPLVENVATGCTMVFNKALRQLLLEYKPSKCRMHDAWVHTVASILGRTIYDEEGYILYRQHSNNVIGAKNKSIKDRVIGISHRMINNQLEPRLENAQELLKGYGNKMSNNDRRQVEIIANYKQSIGNRIRLLSDRQLRPSLLKDNIKYRMLIIAGRI